MGNLQSSFGKLSLFPEKMLEPEPGQARLGFVASGAAGTGELLVNYSRCQALRIVFEQASGVKAGLVIPKEFPLRPIGTILFHDDFVKGRESISLKPILFNTNTL